MVNKKRRLTRSSALWGAIALTVLSIGISFGISRGPHTAFAQSERVAGPTHGALVLAGGGATIPAVMKRFIELGGGGNCNPLAIPSPFPPQPLPPLPLPPLLN